jgi:Uma2 family endonuclease
VASNPASKITEEKYLAIERNAEFRSEFIEGEMFAMSGGTLAQARIQQNLAFELQTALTASGYQAFGSDFRIRVSGQIYTYPDASVVCTIGSDSIGASIVLQRLYDRVEMPATE